MEIDRENARTFLKNIFDAYLDEQNYEPWEIKERFNRTDRGKYLNECLIEQTKNPLINRHEFLSRYGHGLANQTSELNFIMYFDALRKYIFEDGVEPDLEQYFP